MPSYRPLEGKNILLGITGGIAAYKAGDYARRLMELGARILPVMTANAARFITPLTISALTGEMVHSDLFDLERSGPIRHISLAREADVFMVLPATADILAKASSGLADDLLSTLILSFKGPVLFFPSMNPAMYENPITKRNLESLRAAGHIVVEPEVGKTACGEEGRGRLPGWSVVKEVVMKALTPQSLKGRTVLVTAGPTREPIDPVRYISNRSSGRMGFDMARVAYRRGARVVLIHGPVCISAPYGIESYPVETAQEMSVAVVNFSGNVDVVVMAAAVADYTPIEKADRKLKKVAENININLKKTTDILMELIKNKRHNQIVVGFCAETHDLEKEAVQKMLRKQPDLLVANDVSRKDSGFDAATNKVLIVSRDLKVEDIPLLDKEAVAEKIWDKIEGIALPALSDAPS
ncbi:MAG: bifunctional phosphopantothenoylcysteine decarboxylase/phosphopantothenate--cysteine ligase CoaBC [Dissulfurimicrobium hydrothermale]|uniref:bifunctional phosphopantothenoylcysteine decarboxylase/phosphopantothenate--cysteine ligase CoaBC n=1 Tax=Dissulfurimicrobium hydrothermale TaxID=1750598 RepID=UPI003C76C036